MGTFEESTMSPEYGDQRPEEHRPIVQRGLPEKSIPLHIARAPRIDSGAPRGPESWTAVQLARGYFESVRRRRRIVEVPVPGKMARAVREGAQLCPENRYGKIGYEEFLSRTVHAMKAGGTASLLLAGDTEAREEEYMAGGSYTEPLTVINVPKLHTL